MYALGRCSFSVAPGLQEVLEDTPLCKNVYIYKSKRKRPTWTSRLIDNSSAPSYVQMLKSSFPELYEQKKVISTEIDRIIACFSLLLWIFLHLCSLLKAQNDHEQLVITLEYSKATTIKKNIIMVNIFTDNLLCSTFILQLANK